MSERASVYSARLGSGTSAAPVLSAALQHCGGLSTRVFRGARVLLKPNFVAPFPQATTDLTFLEFYVSAVRSAGGIPIVGESSGFEFDTRATLEVLGVHEFVRRHNVALIDFEEASYRSVDLGPGIGTVEVAEAAASADLIINLPVIKGHAVTRMTGAVKNFFGTLSKPSRRRLHARGLHRSIAALARFYQHKAIHLADARRLLTRAVFSEAEALGYVLASLDPFALDHYACALLGVRADQVRHLESVPEYTAVGELPPAFHSAPQRDSLVDRLRRGMYTASYAFDHLKSRSLGGRSILPALHWHLGVHPELDQHLSQQQLQRVALSCPVGAIDVNAARIRRDLCQPVRCLACHRTHPDSIRLVGLNPPSKPYSKTGERHG